MAKLSPAAPSATLTKAAFAEKVGLTRGRISQLITQGLPVGADGRIEAEAGLRWMEDNLDPDRRGKGGAAGTTPSLAEARRLHEIIKVQRARLALDRERGGRRKIVLVSTPTLKGFSRIEAAYEESDAASSRCAARIARAIRLSPGRRSNGRRDGDLVRRICPECGSVHEEHQKPALLATGRWRATAKGDGRTAGFHLSSLYSPFETWAEIAIEHGQVHRDPPRLQVWTNTKLAETWEDQAGEVIDAVPLMARREDWGALLPEGVALLTAGVDVQGDRLELHVSTGAATRKPGRSTIA